MTSGTAHEARPAPRRLWSGSATGQLTVTLLLGAVGAGLVFLASRQGWAHVRTVPPKPLPASNVDVTGAQLVPYADALVLAGLATLAAVLASRGLLRRVTGLLLAAVGAVLAVAAVTVTTAGAISAANAGIGPATATAGSVLAGTDPAASAVPNVAGATPHVTFAAAGWQAVVLVGALAMIAAGVLVAWRATRLAVMSSRYDAPAATDRPAEAEPGPSRTGNAATDSASVWEALSRGEDPTAAGSRRPGG